MKKEMKKAIAALLAVMMLLGMMPLSSLAEEVLEIFQDFSEPVADEAFIGELEILTTEDEEITMQDVLLEVPDEGDSENEASKAPEVSEEEENLLKGFDTMLLALAREASSCGHVNLYVEETIESEAYTSLSKEKHLHSYRLVSRSLCCGDCETTIQTVPVDKTIVETGAHVWYNKGNKLYCEDCSAVRTVKYPCSHKKLSMTESGSLACPKCGKEVALNKEQSGCEHSTITIWEPDQAYVSYYQKISDEKHLKVCITPIYADESRFAICDACGIWLETLNGAIVSEGITDTVYGDAKLTSVQENHSLANGICTLCEEGRLGNTLDMSGAETITAGKTAKYAVVNAEGKTLSASKLTWASSNKSIATVSKGVVTAKKAGTVTISAADASGNFGFVEIRILPKAKSVTLMYNGADAGKTIGIDMAVTGSIQLSAVTAPEDAADAVSWKSSNAKVAKVDANGLVTIKGKGKATITATAKDGSKKKDSVTLNVAVLAKEIKITSAAEIASGKTTKLKAVVTPTQAAKAVSWKSSNTAAATISKDGVVTAKKVSARTSVTITATAKDGSGVTAAHEITICPVVSKVNILYNGADADKTIGIDMAETASIQLGAVTEPADAADAVSWKSSNAKIAKVDENGLVTIKGKGKVTITATAKDGSQKKDTVTLNVAVLAKEITITGAAEITSGKTAKLKAAVTPTNAAKAVSWKSSNTAAATVSSEGVVTAKKVSARTTVTITATAKDGSGVTTAHEIIICPVAAKVVITNAAGEPVNSVELNLRENSGTLQLKAYIEPLDAAQSVSWKSSDTKIAKVDSTGLISALKKGSVTITAKAANGKTATCTIKVIDVAPEAEPEFAYNSVEGGLSITAYTGTGKALVIPAKINGEPVVAIANAAFKDFTKMTSIQIPASVVSIGEDAFNNCDGLTTIELPKGVTKINARTFYGCDNLKTVYLSDDVTEIGAAAFAYCKNLKLMEPK